MAVLLSRPGTGRALAAAALPLAALALASLALVLPMDHATAPGAAGWPTGFLRVNTGLLIAAAGLLTWGALDEWRGGGLDRTWGILGTGVAGMLVLREARELAPFAGPAALLLAVACVAMVLVLRLAIRPVGVSAEPSWWDASSPRARIGGLTILALGLGAQLAWRFELVALCAVGAAWTGYFVARRAHAPGWLVAGPVISLVLLPAVWLVRTVADPHEVPADLASLGQGPFSPAFESLLAPMVLLGAWAVLGLWPLHRLRAHPFTLVAGEAVLRRLGYPLFPLGVMQWEPVAALCLALGVWYGAIRGRPGTVVLSLAALGLLRGGGEAWWVPSAVVAWVLAQELSAGASGRWARWLPWGWIIPGAALARILMLGLEAEVGLTVLLTLGLVGFGWRMGLARER